MIYTPQYLSPKNTVIKPNIDNKFEWTINGIQTHYQIIIRYADTNVQVYDSGKISSSNGYHTLPANTLVNNKSFGWTITSFNGTDSAVSDFAFIETRSGSVVNFTAPDFSGGTPIISGQNYNFMFSYTQAENIPLSHFRLKIYDENGINVLIDSEEIYSYTPIIPIKNMTRGTTYQVELTVVNQVGETISTGKKTFVIDNYNILPYTPEIKATPDNLNATITIDWSTLRRVLGVVTGTSSYTQGKFGQGLLLEQNSDVYFDESFTSPYTFSFYYKPSLPYNGDIAVINNSENAPIKFGYINNRFYIQRGTKTRVCGFDTPLQAGIDNLYTKFLWVVITEDYCAVFEDTPKLLCILYDKETIYTQEEKINIQVTEDVFNKTEFLICNDDIAICNGDEAIL